MFRGLLVGYRVVWYSPLASTNFCRLRAWIFVIPSILFVSEASCGGLWGSCLSSQRTFLLQFMILFLLERQLHFRLLFCFNSNVYIRGLYTWQPGFGDWFNMTWFHTRNCCWFVIYFRTLLDIWFSADWSWWDKTNAITPIFGSWQNCIKAPG